MIKKTPESTHLMPVNPKMGFVIEVENDSDKECHCSLFDAYNQRMKANANYGHPWLIKIRSLNPICSYNEILGQSEGYPFKVKRMTFYHSWLQDKLTVTTTRTTVTSNWLERLFGKSTTAVTETTDEQQPWTSLMGIQLINANQMGSQRMDFMWVKSKDQIDMQGCIDGNTRVDLKVPAKSKITLEVILHDTPENK